ncbi:MAG: hypothetical protein ABIN25_12350 [Ginsengibacter sp.]
MHSLKQQVLQMISSTEDENLLELVKAEIQYFNNTETDIIDDLYYSDKDELLNLANEPDEKETLTEIEFKEVTARWRTK